MREQGLIKKEVWIRPENAKQLSAVEQQLRQANHQITLNVGGSPVDKIPKWTTLQLYDALTKTELVDSGQATMEIIDGSEPALLIEMHEYGDLPVYLTVCGEQIIVESVLWAVSDVIDIHKFNEAVLRTHKYFPLSTISLDKLSNGEDYYHMFGSLSSTSLLANVVFEIEVLASNVLQATQAYSEFLTVSSAQGE